MYGNEMNRICGEMVIVLASSAVDRGLCQTKGYAIAILLRLSTRHQGVRAQIVWLGIRTMCLSGATCLSLDKLPFSR